MKIMGSEAIISFAHANGGLKVMDTTLAHGNTLQGFAIAGADQKWVWATAKIVGDTVVLSSPDVAHPVAVRYAWADAPVCNLFNGVDLPAPPFRTDHWKG
jgi:sialate O-acetylesterase